MRGGYIDRFEILSAYKKNYAFHIVFLVLTLFSFLMLTFIESFEGEGGIFLYKDLVNIALSYVAWLPGFLKYLAEIFVKYFPQILFSSFSGNFLQKCKKAEEELLESGEYDRERFVRLSDDFHLVYIIRTVLGTGGFILIFIGTENSRYFLSLVGCVALALAAGMFTRTSFRSKLAFFEEEKI